MGPFRTSLARTVAAALLTGLVAGGFAIAFRLALERGLELLVGTENVLIGFEHMAPWMRLLLPTAGGFVAGAIGALLLTRKGHAMADVMEAVALGRGRVSPWLVLPKSVASWCALVTGGSLGREGSILQFGAALGDGVGERFGLTARNRRALVAAGTAAGFAAAYNTPIAAIVFVLEVITGVSSLEILLPVILSTTAATVLTRYVIGGSPLYGQRSFALVSEEELLVHAALGLLAGLAGSLFMAFLFGVESWIGKRIGASRLWRPVVGAAGGLVVGALTLVLPQVAGNGFESIQQTLDGRLVGNILLALLVAKGVATVASVATGSPGGVFTPSMFLGAVLGGAVGALAPSLLPGSGPAGGYALVGMAAMLAATTHAPLMAATLAFELSGDYAIVLPLLLATGISAFVSRSLRVDSVYTEELRRRGIHWHGSLAQRLARAVHAKDILDRAVPVVAADAGLDDALRLFDEGARCVYVPAAVARGKIQVIPLDVARGLWAARARGEPVPSTAREAAQPVEAALPEDDLLTLSEKLWHVDEGQIPVVDTSREPSLLGVVTRRAVLGAIDREVLDRDVLLTRIVRHEGAGESADYLELPPGWMVETVSVPPTFIGRTVDHHGLPGETGLLVVAVRPRGRGPLLDATGRKLRGADHLVVMGPAQAIEAFERTVPYAAK